jgi:hypothetical protein
MAINKIINYCWFGDNQPPEVVGECLKTWTTIHPDFEIKKWDETNYDVNKIPFTRDAYIYRDFAFVSDYARWDILYNHGGVYLDTDVMLVKNITPLLEKGPFGGVNLSGFFASGLILALEPGMEIAREMMKIYEDSKYTTHFGQPNLVNCTKRETELLKDKGFSVNAENQVIQEVAGLTIYPKDYFCAYNPSTGKTDITENTYAIHQFTGTWMPSWLRKREMMKSPNIEKHYINIYGTE